MTYQLPDIKTPLSQAAMTDTMTAIMQGECKDEDIANFLSGLAGRGETADEITGAAKVLREKASTINAPHNAVDCCGTGGDKHTNKTSGTYNISTAVAIVSAACGVPIAKHGNRAASSKSGAADVLETMGVNLEMPTNRLEESLKLYNFCFLMAPNHHAAMKHVAPVRKQLSTRTIFNLLGPLANPARTKLQLLGVYDEKWILPMAETLRNLGTKRAWVVHGDDGLDEITITGPTHIAVLNEGQITQKTITPEHFGLPPCDLSQLTGGDATENANALRALLEGQKGAYRDIVLANTAAVLNIHGAESDLQTATTRAVTAIDNGHAYDLLKDYITFSRGADNE